MEKITVIIKEELRKERERMLKESLEPLSKIEDKDVLIEELSKTTIQLLNKGYIPDEIEMIVEQNGLFGNILGSLKDPKTGKWNFWETLFGGGKSMFWEQILVWFSTKVLGLGQQFAQDLAIVFTEYNPLHLLRLFKGYEACVGEIGSKQIGGEEGSGGGFGGMLLEVFVNRAQFGGQAQKPLTGKGFLKVGFRNILGEAVEKSNLDDILAEKICGLIWKKGAASSNENQKSQQQAQEKKPNTQPPPTNYTNQSYEA